jgi:cysteine desulfurase
LTYFDHNATSPMVPQARQAWLEATDKFIGNPSSPHRVGARADAALNEARARLATILGCDALDIVWTSGATESNNMVLHHFAAVSDAAQEDWVSSIEHPCVLETAKSYFPKRLTLIPVARSGVVDLDWMRERLARSRPAFVSVMAANNETGVLQPWSEVLALCREFETPLFCDATQWIGKLPAAGLGECDFVSGSAHKFGGPKGVGFLKCPAKGRVEPLLRGGPQEEGRRAGTENVAGLLAMVAALEVRQAALARAEHKARQRMREAFVSQLKERLPASEVVGAESPRLWNTVSALMPEAGCQSRWVIKLDKLGFAVSTGSACASGNEEPSHVLIAMGRSAAEASRSLRFSSGWETSEAEWDALLAALVRINERA